MLFWYDTLLLYTNLHDVITYNLQNSSSGFQFISKWQGTASSWQALGPASPALGYITDEV